jgi:hypothetical protein
MMPTFAPLPSIVPVLDEDDDESEVAGWVAGAVFAGAELELPPPLDPQAARAKAAAALSTAAEILLLRIRTPLSLGGPGSARMNVVRANI